MQIRGLIPILREASKFFVYFSIEYAVRTFAYHLAALFCMVLFGFARIFRAHTRIRDLIALAVTCDSHLQRYINSTGNDTESHEWLFKNIFRLNTDLMETISVGRNEETDLGSALTRIGVYYRDLRLGVLGRAKKRELGNIEAALKEALLRRRGFLELERVRLGRMIFNPYFWTKEGARLVVFLPVSILEWLGLISIQRAVAIKENSTAAAIANIVTFLGAISAIVGLVVDWQTFVIKLEDWLR